MPAVQAQLELSVVMPCLNEAATVGSCVDTAITSLRALAVDGEVIVADNGSTDGSQDFAREAGARVVDVLQRGYGSALAAGIEAAHGTFVIMGDADGTYDFSRLGGFLERLRAGDDLVLGNRFAGGIDQGAMPLLHRYVGNPILTLIAKRLFKSPAGDIYCGLRGFRRAAVQALNLRSTGMEFAIEMVVKSSMYGLRIAEVPTRLSPDDRERRRHLRTWRDGWRSLRFLLLYSPSWLFLYPGLFAMLAGTLVTVFLALRARTIGGVTFDVHTLLYAATTVVIGYQAVIFSVGARLFAIAEGLLPASRRWERLFRVVSLEAGIVVGVAFLAVGLTGSVYEVVHWGNRSFGPLAYASTLRLVIPASVLIALGWQTILASFFLSILALRRR